MNGWYRRNAAVRRVLAKNGIPTFCKPLAYTAIMFIHNDARPAQLGCLVLQLSLAIRRRAIAALFPVTDLGGGLIQASPE